jgi:hypothetical protein
VDEKAREEITARLRSLMLQHDLENLREARKRAADQGTHIESLPELVTRGLLPAIPSDPFGGEYWLDPAGEVRSNHEDQLLRLHVFPGKAPIEPTYD